MQNSRIAKAIAVVALLAFGTAAALPARAGFWDRVDWSSAACAVGAALADGAAVATAKSVDNEIFRIAPEWSGQLGTVQASTTPQDVYEIYPEFGLEAGHGWLRALEHVGYVFFACDYDTEIDVAGFEPFSTPHTETCVLTPDDDVATIGVWSHSQAKAKPVTTPPIPWPFRFGDPHGTCVLTPDDDVATAPGIWSHSQAKAKPVTTPPIPWPFRFGDPHGTRVLTPDDDVATAPGIWSQSPIATTGGGLSTGVVAFELHPVGAAATVDSVNSSASASERVPVFLPIEYPNHPDTPPDYGNVLPCQPDICQYIGLPAWCNCECGKITCSPFSEVGAGVVPGSVCRAASEPDAVPTTEQAIDLLIPS